MAGPIANRRSLPDNLRMNNNCKDYVYLGCQMVQDIKNIINLFICNNVLYVMSPPAE